MKKISTGFIILFCSASLISCANVSNQDMGTVTGGVAGGLLGSTLGQGGGRVMAIAAGSIAGALIGSQIGKSMDETDKLKMARALESNSVGQPAYWKNTNTGASYKVVPTKNVTIDGNDYCREYRSVANIGGKSQQVYGTACRQPDGTWKVIG